MSWPSEKYQIDTLECFWINWILFKKLMVVAPLISIQQVKSNIYMKLHTIAPEYLSTPTKYSKTVLQK